MKAMPEWTISNAMPGKAPVMVGVSYRRRGVILAPVRRFINRLKDVLAEVPAG